MGCFSSRPASQVKPPPGKSAAASAPAPKLDPKDFIFTGLKATSAIKAPGSIKGQQFIIEECSDCTLMLLDQCGPVTIDLCTNCCIFVGPSESSVFIRDCQDCIFVVACQQFRSRDCSNSTIFLYTLTQPIVEKSKGLKFGCFQANYKDLPDQFKASNLISLTNQWSDLYDFSAKDGLNWTLLPPDANPAAYFKLPSSESIPSDFSWDRGESFVPFSLGKLTRPHETTIFSIFFMKDDQQVANIIRRITKETSSVLIQSKKVQLPPSTCDQLLSKVNDSSDRKRFQDFAKQGPVFVGEICSADPTIPMKLITENFKENVVVIDEPGLVKKAAVVCFEAINVEI